MGWISIFVVFLLLFLGVHVAFALSLVGFLGYVIIGGTGPALSVMGVVPFGSIAMYALSVIPLFLLMGNFAFHAGLGSDIFRAMQHLTARIPGGLAQATVAGCAVFGAVSGSGLAACAMMSKIAIPEMIKHGYDRKLAIGVVGAAGPLAQMIPPSILMVIYGIITDTSIGKLLIAGIIPGIICAINYMLLIYIRAKRNPSIAPLFLKKISRKESFLALKNAWAVGILAFIIIGGIYSGAFTPTEAGGIAAFFALALSLFMKRLSWKGLADSLSDSVKITGMIFLIMVGAYIFGTFLAISQLPFKVSEFLTTLPVHRFFILAGIMVLYLILGTFLDMIAAMFLTLPIIFPAIQKLGYDPIWFGVLIVQQAEIALLTPPYGLNLFILKGAVPEASMGEIIKGVFPFLCVAILTLAIYVVFPQVVLFLPGKMG